MKSLKFQMNLVANKQNITDVIKYIKDIIDGKNIVVLLQGDLASGKTTLVKEYLSYIGSNSEVTSPTFSLQSIYSNNIYHYDIYNKTINEFISLGMLEEFEKDGIHFVEWGDDKLEKLLLEYGFDILKIQIKKLEDKREYIIG